MKTVALDQKIKIGRKELKLYYYENNLWLTLNSISEFFNCSINQIYISLKQLEKTSKINLKKFNKHLPITLQNGKTTVGNFFSLEILIAIAYKINPKKALQLYKLSLTSYQNILIKSTPKKESFTKKLSGLFIY